MFLYLYRKMREKFPTWLRLKELVRNCVPGEPVRIYINQLERFSLSESLPGEIHGGNGCVELVLDRSRGHVVMADELLEAIRVGSYMNSDQVVGVRLRLFDDRGREDFASLSKGYGIRVDEEDPNTFYIEGEVVFDKNMTTYMG